jgi:hypothetical protein
MQPAFERDGAGAAVTILEKMVTDTSAHPFDRTPD